jgi:hypothetical protein
MSLISRRRVFGRVHLEGFGCLEVLEHATARSVSRLEMSAHAGSEIWMEGA